MIYNGTTEIVNIFMNGKEIQAVYKGAKEVWTNKKKIYYLGSGKTFNVVSFCNSNGIDYKSLTIDDFFFTPYSNSITIASGSCSSEGCTYGVNCWCGSGNATGSAAPGSGSTGTYNTQRSYNASTGALTLYFGVNANVYIVPDSATYITKGLITTVTSGGNVSSDTKGYSSATSANFLYRTLPSKYDGLDYCCSSGCPYGFSWQKSYNVSNATYSGGFSGTRTGWTSASAFYFSPTKFKFIK